MDGEFKRFIITCAIVWTICFIGTLPKVIKDYNTLEVQAIINDDTAFKDIYNNWKIEDLNGRIFTLSKIVNRNNFDIDTFIGENINK